MACYIKYLHLFASIIHFWSLQYFQYVSCNVYNNESFENVTEAIFDYGILKNDSAEVTTLDKNFDDDSFLIGSNNLREENNITEPDPVVTEDWDNPNIWEPSRKYLSFTTPDEDICSCDLYKNACDINCCCDSDCSEEDMKVFSKCISQSLTPDKNYCYQKDIIFRNNTVYKMEKDPESSLFCIVHDNLKQHLRFKDMPVINSHRDLDLLLKYQSKSIYSWDSEKKNDLIDQGEIRAGNPIYIEAISEKYQSESQWSLPSSCFSRVCSCNEEIRYLEDFTSICSRTISSLKTECQPNSVLSAGAYSDFCISHTLSLDVTTHLSDLITHVKVMNSVQENFTHSNKICSEKSVIKPKYISQQNLCVNVVTGIHFTVIHAGYNGIIDISTKFEYINISAKEDSFFQRFSVNFKWYNATDAVKKSGNPGYQVGLPVLAGTNGSVFETEDSYAIKIKSDGLSVLDRDQESLCIKARKTIKFGKNFKSSCIIKHGHSENCDAFQERISEFLLGSSKKQVFVGVFGNANESNIDDWIEAYHEDREKLHNDGTCSLVTGLRINIAYAAVGTVVNPQFKILGVGYHYSKPQVIDFSYLESLMLSTSVSFFDATEPAISHYPKVPSIKANLPSDFFYPFLYGNCIRYFSNAYLIIFMFFNVLIYSYI